jgi:hypothetical protein
LKPTFVSPNPRMGCCRRWRSGEANSLIHR